MENPAGRVLSGSGWPLNSMADGACLKQHGLSLTNARRLVLVDLAAHARTKHAAEHTGSNQEEFPHMTPWHPPKVEECPKSSASSMVVMTAAQVPLTNSCMDTPPTECGGSWMPTKNGLGNTLIKTLTKLRWIGVLYPRKDWTVVRWMVLAGQHAAVSSENESW